MATRKVKLKNREGDYLYPYTDNIPVDIVPKSGSENPITSGAVHTAFANVTNTQNALKTELVNAIATAKQEAITEAKLKYTVTSSLPSSPESGRFYFITG